MKWTDISPILLIVLNLSNAVSMWAKGEPPERVLYWIAAAAINICVLYPSLGGPK